MRKRNIAQQPEEGGADCRGALEEPRAILGCAMRHNGLGSPLQASGSLISTMLNLLSVMLGMVD